MENEVDNKNICSYGISTWRAFRVNRFDQYYIDFLHLDKLVNERFGKKHNFKFVFAPINLAMPEAFLEKYQFLNSENEPELNEVSILKATSELGYNFVAVSPFMSGLTLQVPLPTSLTKANYIPSKQLNLIRSLPYESLLSVCFGAKKNRHLKINLNTCYLDLMQQGDFDELFFNSLKREQAHETEVTTDEFKFMY